MRLLILAAAVLLAGCDPLPTPDTMDVEGSETITNPTGKFDEQAARREAARKVSLVSFEDVGKTSQCGEDCAAQEAGFQWAIKNSPDDPTLCSRAGSEAFKQGCIGFHDAVENELEMTRGKFKSQ